MYETTGPRRRGWMLAVLLTAIFLAQFDFFVVNVATPSISTQLGAGPAALELIVGGYAFAFASGLVTGGRLGDLYGFRRMFILGMAAFTVTSLLCAVATSVPVLVLARLAQGASAAVMVPQVLATITATFPAGAGRAWAIGWLGAAGGLGAVSANVLGGALLAASPLGLGWRTIFLVNLPIGLAAALLAGRLFPPVGGRGRTGLDPLGALGIAAALALLLVPLAMGRGEGWPAWVWASLAAGVAMSALTVRGQRRLARRGGAPVLDPALFRVRSYVLGVAEGAGFQLYFGGFVFCLTQFLQIGLRLDPLRAGLMFLASALAFAASSPLCMRLAPRFGRRVPAVGGLVVATGLASLAVQLVVAGPSVSALGVLCSITLVGAGNGAVLPQLIGAALVDVEPSLAGVGAAVLNTAQQFGSSAGVAVVGTLFFAVATGPHGGQPRAMAVAAGIDAALVLLVSASHLGGKATAQWRAPRPGWRS